LRLLDRGVGMTTASPPFLRDGSEAFETLKRGFA
jgi:hypothetical protein